MTNIVDFFTQKDFVILGGAMGTELQRRGYKTKLPLWSASANEDAPELVEQIHTDYFNAGADLCITNTFRTTPRAYDKVGRKKDARDALNKSVEIALRAKEKAGRPVFCGGSYAPLEDCYEPDLVPSRQELEDEHGLICDWLKEAGVDFLIAETINDIEEAQVMAQSASNAGLPYIISFVVDSKANLLDGSALTDVLKVATLEECFAVSLNCRPIDVLDSAAHTLLENTDLAKGIYPNGFGKPHDDLGWEFENNDDSIEKFVQIALNWNKQGFKLIGGCCGTTPDYIRALSQTYQVQKQAA